MATYDFNKYSLIIGGKRMTNFMDGTGISFERRSDAYVTKVGISGNVSRSKTNDTSAVLKFTLMQTAEENNFLSALAITDETTGLGVVPVLLTDAIGTTNIATGKAWIRKQPRVDLAGEITGREWIFDCAVTVYFVGGNPAF